MFRNRYEASSEIYSTSIMCTFAFQLFFWKAYPISMEDEIIYDYITYKININTVWLLVIIAVLKYCFITTLLYKLNT